MFPGLCLSLASIHIINNKKECLGAVAGVATQYTANQVFNPCRNRNTNSNQGTKNRLFLGNNPVANGGVGFLAGLAGASVLNTGCG